MYLGCFPYIAYISMYLIVFTAFWEIFHQNPRLWNLQKICVLMGDFNIEPLKTAKNDNGKLFYNNLTSQSFTYCNQLGYILFH